MRVPGCGYVVGSLLTVLTCSSDSHASTQQKQDMRGSGGVYTQAVIDAGARLYAASCATCHGTNGDAVGSANFRSGKFRHATTDQDLQRIILNGLPSAGMPPHKLDPSELTAIVAYVRHMPDALGRSDLPGDPVRGKALFEGKGGCLTCHRVNGQGSHAAPDLSDIGSVRSAASLHVALTDPSRAMMPINRPVRAVTKGGKVITGRRLNEDTYTVQIFDDQERFVSLDKAELHEYKILMQSPMPSFQKSLSSGERFDIVAYLVTLKGW